MSSWFRRAAALGVLGTTACLGASVQAQPAGAASAAHGQPPAASAPIEKKKRASTAKTPPGNPPRGAGPCEQGDKAHRQRCLHDMYGPVAPRA